MIAAARRRAREPAANAAHDDARELTRLVADCAAAAIGRSALVLRLSLLAREQAQPHHLRLARATLDPLNGADRARRFELANNDTVCVFRGEAAEAVAACRAAIDHLYADDDTGAPRRPDGLLRLLSLPADGAALLALVEASLAPEEAAPAAPRPPAPPLDLARLATLELSLQQADVARFARRRPVCVLEPGGRLGLAWEKRFLSIEELAADLLPDRSARADPWLFRRLTRTLDRRMLALLWHPEDLREAGRFSLNLNVATILSPEFLRFDQALPARLRGAVILEVHPADVMADATAFLFAREFTHVRGYALLLRGLSPMLLRALPRAAMGVDWLELRWSADLAERADPFAAADRAAIVLGRADTPAALDWARARGITHIRGRAAQPAAARTG